MSMTLIEHIELTTTTASIEFTSIPADYTDLYVLLSLRDSTTGDSKGNYYTIVFNNSATSTTARYLQGYSSVVTTGALNALAGIASTNASTANSFANDSFYVPNYTASQAKSYSIDSSAANNAAAYQTLVAGLWNVTDAVTSLKFTPSSGSWLQYSSATLYGITAGSDGTTTVS